MSRWMRRTRGRMRRWRYEAPGLLSYWTLRPRTAGVDASVVLETWDAVADGTHNSNTDLTYWDGWFYLCHQTSCTPGPGGPNAGLLAGAGASLAVALHSSRCHAARGRAVMYNAKPAVALLVEGQWWPP